MPSPRVMYVGPGPEHGFLEGVPARDLEDEEFAALTPEQQQAVAACGLYEFATATDEPAPGKDERLDLAEASADGGNN